MKSQALIVQFIIFFLIGLSLFLSIGNFFKYQLDVFRSDASFHMRKLISSYVSSAIVSSLACNQCDFVNSTLKLQKTSLGYFIELSLSSYGLNISSVPENKQYLSSIHNMNSSLSLGGRSSSAKTITFTFDRIHNQLYFEMKPEFIETFDFVIVETGSSYAAINKEGVTEITSTNASEVFEYVFNRLTSTGGKVLIKEGTYYLSSPNYLPSNIFVKGEGYLTVLYLSDNSNIEGIFMNKDFPSSTIYNVTIRDLKFYGNRYNQQHGGAFVAFRSAENVLIENIYIEEATFEYDAIIFSLSKNIIIRNTVSRGIGVTDGAPIGIRGSSNVLIDNLNSINSTADGIWVGYEDQGVPQLFYSKYVKILNSNIERAGRNGIMIDVETGNTTVLNTIVKNSGQNPVYTWIGDKAGIRILGHNVTISNVRSYDDQTIKTQTYGGLAEVVSGYTTPTGIVIRDSDFCENLRGGFIKSPEITDIIIDNVQCA